jgi:hypothetical protein
MATDWTASFQDLNSKAVESYARFVAHSQNLLTRIYTGELAPTSLQDHLPGFLNERGTKFYAELTQLSFSFFIGLMRLSTQYSTDYFRGLMPDYNGPDVPEPTDVPDDLRDWTRWYQVLTARMAEQNERSISGYNKLLQKIGRGELSASSVQDFSRTFAKERGSEYARDAAELNFRFFDGLVRLNQRYNDELFDRLTTNGNGAGHYETPAEPLYVDLKGPVGSTVSVELTIENTNEDRSEVYCAVSQFRNTDGSGPAFDAPIEIEPAQFSLRPDDAISVNVRLLLRDDLFTAGRVYAGTMVVRGNGDQDALIFLVAKPAEP